MTFLSRWAASRIGSGVEGSLLLTYEAEGNVRLPKIFHATFDNDDHMVFDVGLCACSGAGTVEVGTDVPAFSLSADNPRLNARFLLLAMSRTISAGF